MDDRFDQLTRWLEVAHPRRSTLGGGLAALTSLGLATNSAEVEAKKKHKKKRKKKPKKMPPPTCAQLCGFNCAKCVFRADAPPLCGDFSPTLCSPCASDNDCVDGNHPYCVTQVENRATGEINNLCDPDQPCGACEPGVLGRCVDVTGCGP